uniref:Major histocompatibility complex class I UBA n=1 Tax=Astyanax mexicanus TaxID=7994 RepID=W5KAF1_ASTMX
TGVTPGISFPEFTATGQLNEHQIGYYNTSQLLRHLQKTRKIVLCVRIPNMGMMTSTELVCTVNKRHMCYALISICICRGSHVAGEGYKQFGYDGEDFLSLDVNDEYWTAATPQAVPFKRKWEKDGLVSIQKKFLETECFERIKKYVEYGKSVFERKVKVCDFKDSSSPVVCHATGFFPKAVMVSWEKNGEELNEDVELRETLPNQDGTFQKRSILTLSPEELNRNKYTCVVQHEGLKKEIILQVSDLGIMVGIIIGVVVAVLLLGIIGFAGVLMWKKRKKNSGK